MSTKKIKIISGFEFPYEMPDLMCHLQLFLKAPEFQRQGSSIYTGTGRAEHSKIISQILWPKAFEWHDWSERIDEEACGASPVSLSKEYRNQSVCD